MAHSLRTTGGMNPLLSDWHASSAYGLPPFASIKAEHFKPAFQVGMDHQLAELQEIVSCPETPSFDNTIAPFDRCGGILSKVGAAFSALCASNSPAEIQAVQTEMAPLLAAHESAIYMFPGLFARIDAVPVQGLTNEQARLVDRLQLDFVRAGAKFSLADQKAYAAIMEELSVLTTQFQQNLLADESQVTVDLTEEDFAGCPSFLIDSAKQAAKEKNKAPGVLSITLSRSSVEPFLTFASRRDLRQNVFEQWTRRGQLDASRDNASIAKKILLLRCDQAEMHGYETFAAYQTADTMSKTPAAVMELLERVWTPACASANRERALLEKNMLEELGQDAAAGGIEAWDWRYYAERVRLQLYDFDESLLKPYLPLEAMQNAVFDTAGKLFGLRFEKVKGVGAYHEDVEVFEVREAAAGGSDILRALFLHDNFARANKRSGAWMSDLRGQSRNSNAYAVTQEVGVDAAGDSAGVGVRITATASAENVVPIVMNNNNFARGSPTLLSFDDAITLFHEAGHGLHGMLSDVSYNRLSGTNVLRDFVELPSQLLEHWLRSTSEVLQKHARHYETGELIPAELLEKLTAARNFNQGFATVEYTICALVDQSLHSLTKQQVGDLDFADFERKVRHSNKVSTRARGALVSHAHSHPLSPSLPLSLSPSLTLGSAHSKELERLKMPRGIIMRHRPTHFQHLFADSGYAAAYYVYLWAEVLDASAFDSFLEKGDVFNQETAQRLRNFIYSKGNSVEPNLLFESFKGSPPSIEPMLRKKGLV